MTRDRTGEPLDDDADPFEHECDRGWIDRSTSRPCCRCKPWLRDRRPPTRAELDAFQARHPTPRRTP